MELVEIRKWYLLSWSIISSSSRESYKFLFKKSFLYFLSNLSSSEIKWLSLLLFERLVLFRLVVISFNSIILFLSVIVFKAFDSLWLFVFTDFFLGKLFNISDKSLFSKSVNSFLTDFIFFLRKTSHGDFT